MKESGMTQKELMIRFNMSRGQVDHACRRARRLRKDEKVNFEDRKESSSDDVKECIRAAINLQEKINKVDTKQVKATIELKDDKPVAIAHWGDIHVGGIGVDYKLFEEDFRKIRDTEGLYFFGTGDYKDNFHRGGPPAGMFEQVLQPGMQDKAVATYMEELEEKALALVRGCHDHWDKTSTDRDFVEHLCHLTGAVNLWHGGEVLIRLGDQEYHWRLRHKYKYQSSLNLENAMRRIMEIQGPCDVAGEAHLHDGYIHQRHLMGEYRVLLRSGTYKVWDEHGQRIAGYEGKVSVPTTIIRPGRKAMTVELFLDDAIETLEGLRSRA